MAGFMDIKSKLIYNDFNLISEKIRESLDRLQANGNGIKSGDNVAVKVNVPVPLAPDTAACTHPVIAEALAEQLKRIGANVTFYEDCFRNDAIEISGMKKIAERTGIEFVNLNGHKCTEVSIGTNVYKYYEEIYNADHLVSLPKIKTHLLTNFTGAIKNMYGCISKEQRKMFHRLPDIEDFCRILVEVFSIKIPDLVIMDGIIGMEGAGPTHGMPINSGILIISDDAVLVDYYTSLIMGYSPMQILTNQIAINQKLNKYQIDEIEFVDENYKDLNLKYKTLPLLSGKMRQRFIKLSRGSLDVSKDLCTYCGICQQSCPYQAIKMEGIPIIDSSSCMLCYCCAELCPNGAIKSQKSIK